MKYHLLDFMEIENWEILENEAIGDFDLDWFGYPGSPQYDLNATIQA